MLGVVFCCVLLTVFAAAAALTPQDAVRRRFGESRGGGSNVGAPGLALRVAAREERQKGFWSFVLPNKDEERSRIRRTLWRAGFQTPHAVRNYFALRTALAVLLPLPIVLVVL